MNPVVLGVLGVSALLGAISVVVPIARRFMLPYTLVLAVLGCLIGFLGYLNFGVAGLGASIAGGLREIGLLDDAFIYIFLPPLLFSAGLTVDIRHILEDVGYVLLLAFVAVVLCTIFVGYSLMLVTGLGLLPCLLFGTVVSTTDTAAVINIFRESGAPKRLSAIVEGEALFNDAAAIAMFGLFLSMVTLGTSLDLFAATREFLLALIGGALFGYAMARLCGWLISLLQDSVTTEVTLTVALTYLTFVVSNEVLGISGVVATVTLATFVGSDSRTRVSPGSWEILHNVWEHLDFWATSFIFIISAMYIPRALGKFDWHDLLNVAVVFVAALASRAVVIGAMMPTFSAIGASKPLRRAYKLVLWWGGMRGAVTVALALTTTATDGIPEPVRHLVASTAIGYVIASLVINGLSLRPLMNRLRLDKFNDLDLALRGRIVNLARRRIRKELHDVAAAVGHDAEELSRSVIPITKLRIYKTKTVVDLSVALDTWCHHELDTVLMFRERGLITRHQADALRHHTDRLLNALRDGGVQNYEAEAERLRRVAPLLRIAFWLHRRFGWRRTLRSAISVRMEYLVAEQLLIRELLQQCEANAATLFGKDVEPDLHAILSRRATATAQEINAIENVYPKFAHAMRQRYLTLVALGLVEAEYRRHLAEATISADVFEDLDAQRRAIAARFTRRQHHELELDNVSAADAFPLVDDYPALRAGIRSYVTFPGQAIEITRRRRRYALFVVFGQIEAIRDSAIVTLKPGDFFGQKAFFGLCAGVSSATSLGYTNMLEVDLRLLKSLMRTNPDLKERLSPRVPRQKTLATAS